MEKKKKTIVSQQNADMIKTKGWCNWNVRYSMLSKTANANPMQHDVSEVIYRQP